MQATQAQEPHPASWLVSRFRYAVFDDACFWLHGALGSRRDQRKLQAHARELLRDPRNKPLCADAPGEYRQWLVGFLCRTVYAREAAGRVPAIDVHDLPLRELALDKRVTPYTYSKYLTGCRRAGVAPRPDIESIAGGAQPPGKRRRLQQLKQLKQLEQLQQLQRGVVGLGLGAERRTKCKTGGASTKKEGTRLVAEERRTAEDAELRTASPREPQRRSLAAALERVRLHEGVVAECEAEASRCRAALEREPVRAAEAKRQLLAATEELVHAARARADAVVELQRIDDALREARGGRRAECVLCGDLHVLQSMRRLTLCCGHLCCLDCLRTTLSAALSCAADSDVPLLCPGCAAHSPPALGVHVEPAVAAAVPPEAHAMVDPLALALAGTGDAAEAAEREEWEREVAERVARQQVTFGDFVAARAAGGQRARLSRCPRCPAFSAHGLSCYATGAARTPTMPRAQRVSQRPRRPDEATRIAEQNKRDAVKQRMESLRRVVFADTCRPARHVLQSMRRLTLCCGHLCCLDCLRTTLSAALSCAADSDVPLLCPGCAAHSPPALGVHVEPAVAAAVPPEAHAMVDPLALALAGTGDAAEAAEREEWEREVAERVARQQVTFGDFVAARAAGGQRARLSRCPRCPAFSAHGLSCYATGAARTPTMPRAQRVSQRPRRPDEATRIAEQNKRDAVKQRMESLRRVVFADTCRWLHGVLRSAGDQHAMQARSWRLCKGVHFLGDLNSVPGAYRRWVVQFLCANTYVGRAAPAIDVEDPPIKAMASDPRMMPSLYGRFLADCRGHGEAPRSPSIETVLLWLEHAGQSALARRRAPATGLGAAAAPEHAARGPATTESCEHLTVQPPAILSAATAQRPRVDEEDCETEGSEARGAREAREGQLLAVEGHEERQQERAQQDSPLSAEELAQRRSAALELVRTCDAVICECRAVVARCSAAIDGAKVRVAEVRGELLAACADLADCIAPSDDALACTRRTLR
eukprot:m51a1_g7836 hypothetical protein (991) ;mRNA; f:177743-181685